MKKNAPNAEPIVSAAPGKVKQLSVSDAMALAARLQVQGKLPEAEVVLRQILAARPKYPPALNLLGVIAHQAGRLDLAIDLVGQAIFEDDLGALFHANIGEMHRQAGDVGKAIEHGKRAVALDPMLAWAHSNLGIAHYDNKDFDRAENCQRLALKINPQSPRALNNLGSIMREHKRMDEAMAFYRRAYAADPKYLEPLNNLGSVLATEERFDEAVEALAKALLLDPKYADAHCNIGFALRGLEQFEQALRHFQTALELRPNYPEALIGISRILQEKQDLPKALEFCQKAIGLAPDKADGHSLLGAIYTEMEEAELAAACFEKALSLKPDLHGALVGLGNLRMEMGEMDAAGRYFEQALAVSPANDPSARFYLAQVKKVKPGDANMAALEAAGEGIGSLPESKRLILHFALGKCYDDIGDIDRAMPHFLAGCRLKRRKINHDPAAQERIFAEVTAALGKPEIDALRGSGASSSLPVFVLGMPRSGTTLTEQIIASHPKAHGAGELKDLLRIANRQIEADGERFFFPFNLNRLTPEILTKWGEDYIAGLRRRAPDASRITDKLPGNYLVVGLIHLMLPNARIVHVRRNPVDTCLSCFARLFHHGQEHTYDLAELGRYYKGYSRVMEHWRRVLPAGSFHEIQYENLVADTESEARKLIDYCGLDWDDACLEFHATRRKVRTASVTQVRQPIYATSVERWRAYEKYLEPLLRELGELVPR